jgi:hypothetical protein
MANDVTNALSTFSDPNQFIQWAAQALSVGGAGALATASAQLVADGRPDLAANLANAADYAATVNGRPDIKAFIEGGGLASAVQHMLWG